MSAGISGSSPTRRNDERRNRPQCTGRAIAMRTIRLALSDATLSKCSDIGTMDARPKKPRALGVKARGPQAPGFAIDSPGA